jgi:hypothetical protein
MSDWFHRWFGGDTPKPYQFGRGINAALHPDEFELYTQSMTAFEEGRILDAYEAFLNSLINFTGSRSNANLSVIRLEERLEFELLQGCVIVRGSVTDKVFKAHACIADASHTGVAVKRRLIERNYQLTYSRYYRHEETLSLKIYLDNSSMSPQKVFFPLRELALNGDYEKEFMAAEFGDTPLLELDHLRPIDEEEKRMKFRFMQEWIADCLDSIKHLPANDNAGMIAFTYLTLMMQIDYLIVPRKKLGREIMKEVGDYFREDEKGVDEKNSRLRTFVEQLEATEYDTLTPQLYRVTLTFSPLERATHDDISGFIDDTLGKVRWYKSNRYPKIMMTIYRYIPLYLLFNYGMHPSLHGLLHLLVEIQHPGFFKAFGYAPLHDPESERFEKRTITRRVAECLNPYVEQFPQLSSFEEELNFTDLEKFSYSFLFQLKHLDYSEY